jgi:hypothetical protein
MPSLGRIFKIVPGPPPEVPYPTGFPSEISQIFKNSININLLIL